MAEEEHVPQLDGPAAIVLGELVLIKLRKRRCQSLLDLARERYTPVLPVDSDKLGELVGTLDDTRKRLRNRRTVSLLARHLADKQERCMTQLHLLTSAATFSTATFGTSSAMRPAISTPSS